MLGAAGDWAAAGDWPMWRYGASRGASAPDTLPQTMQLQWKLTLPAPQPAWPDSQQKLDFDGSYEPVAAGHRLFVPSMVADSVTAYDTRSGKELWRYDTNGPVRFAPACWRDAVFFASDDGWLYCVGAEDGKLRWKFRGGPRERRVVGNDRLISTWPARGAPTIHEDTVYFAAGVFPFMGIFVHALDAESGEVRWTNSGSGANYLVQPHGSPAFAGVAPQGYLAVSEDVLVVPGGRGVPAGYDLATGRFLYCHVGTGGKGSGGYDITTGKGWFASRGSLCCVYEGTHSSKLDVVAAGDETVLCQDGDKLTALSGDVQRKVVEKRDRRGRRSQETEFHFATLWDAELPRDAKNVLIHAGQHVYATDGKNKVVAVQLPAKKGEKAETTWSTQIEGTVWNVLAADDRLFVVSREGEIFCFGEGQPPKPTATTGKPAATADKNSVAWPIKEIVNAAGGDQGFCVVLGAGNGNLLKSLAQESKLHVVAVEPNEAQAAACRRQLGAANLLGRRAAVLHADWKNTQDNHLPPYLANLILADQDAATQIDGPLLTQFFNVLRPYGGALVLLVDNAEHARLAKLVKDSELPGAKLERAGDLTIIRRPGPLPGSAPWTHNNADVGNSLISLDSRVKAPLGLLWFGGPPNDEVLPRHGHGPTPQVIGGRVIVQGPDMLRAVDSYTGRLLWQRELPGVGMYYNNTGHHPGAGAIGSNYVSVEDGIYVAYERKCLWLDPKTGQTLAEFTLPIENGEPPYWGYIGVYDDLLIAGASPIVPLTQSHGTSRDSLHSRFAEGSARLAVLNRHNGKVLWTRDAKYNFRHNAIVAGGGKVFCIDRMTDVRRVLLKRRGQDPQGDFQLFALDARTGKVAWSTTDNVFGTWLSYSAEHDLLVQAISRYRDRAKDEEAKGLAVYKAGDGKLLWQNDDGYGGPVLLRGDMIITQGEAYELLTGEAATRAHPLSGARQEWEFTRNYGCNTVIGCTNLLTFRSAAAGFFDLAGDGGTGNFGGFRSSCTSNLVPADGVLNAPDYTRTCSCNYQLQCSLAMVHEPDVPVWTFQSMRWDGKPVTRAGINFGAPGDRRDGNGTLWLDYPSVGGRSPDLPVEIEGDEVAYFRQHASHVSGEGYPWVASSGVAGARRIVITLSEDKESPERAYTVQLHFAQLVQGEGKSRFDVSVQGRRVLEVFDVAKAAGGLNRSLVRKFEVTAGHELVIELNPIGDSQTTLSGVEVVAK